MFPRGFPEVIPQENVTPPIIRLAKIAFASISHEPLLQERLQSCFQVFRNILPFDSPLDLETVLVHSQFDHPTTVHSLYGVIHSYDISKTLQHLVIRRHFSLQKLCYIALMKMSPPVMTIEELLAFPDHHFREFIITSFSILWLPMSHWQFHQRTNGHHGVPNDLQMVFNFLSNPCIFERMYRSCRDVQIFIFSWLQHCHFYPERAPQHAAQTLKHPDHNPLLPPHQLSAQLVANLRELLNRCSLPKQNTPFEVTSVALFGLKVANFLSDSSEYVHAYKAARAVHQAVRAFFGLSQHPIPLIRLEYEVLCVLLRSMNAYNLYLDPDDQRMFLKEAPAILNSIKHFGLLLHQSDGHSPWSDTVLPPSLLYDSVLSDSVAYTRRSVSLPLPEEPIMEDFVTPTSSIHVGPSGDAYTISAHDNVGAPLPAPVLPKSFPCLSHSSSADVLNILDATPRPNICVVFLHAQLANYYYAMCKYLAAHQFVLLSIEQLRGCTRRGYIPSINVVVEVLRIMCKICMIKRKYSLGLRIIRQALMLTRAHFGAHNVTYASLLLEYGCLMLNTDKTRKAARVYRVALTVILSCLPGSSIMAALALEAIAYAHYVLEYTSGDFTYALNCAEVAGLMLRRLNHEMCMQAASANRVKALIIEEIAIDDNDSGRTREFLYLARDLHMESLNLCERTFGLWNVQTAKHFGNLGRLYQSMQENKLAEIMHRKAIMIKERLLGASDFEVGLSVGHLASLYNYDMERYRDAEQLYLRSVQISLDLFGPTYSGLEYDYRGLQRVYHELGNRAEMRKYQMLFDQWQRLREKPRNSDPVESTDELEPLDVVRDDNEQWSSFFQLADDYEQEFKLIFPHPASSSDECHTPSTSRTNNCTHHGSSASEASRSTGY